MWKRQYIKAVICAAAIWTGSAVVKEALREGEGLLTAGGVHSEMDAAWNVREKGRIDFSMMEFELGLKKGRGLGEAEGGVWGRREHFVMEREERIKLAKGLESLGEFAESRGVEETGVRLICAVGGRGEGSDGVVEREEVIRGCRTVAAEIVEVETTHFNLTGLFAEVVERITGEKEMLQPSLW